MAAKSRPPFCVRIPVAMDRALRQAARTKQMTLSEVARAAFREWLSQYQAAADAQPSTEPSD